MAIENDFLVQQSQIDYGYKLHLDHPYDEVVTKVKDELKKEGFGVLSEIDVQAKLNTALGADFRKYLILGACNPELAFEALQQELDIGLMLPCNVVIYEDEGGCTVAVARPDRMAESAHNPNLEPVARQADEKLRRALTRLH